jgi:hypothetical protein
MRTARTFQDKLAEPQFGYGEVEDGLAVALDIEDSWRTLFRSRIKHFQRLGINGPGVRPGRGASFKYSFEQAARLAIVFLLADVGLDPALSVQLIDKFWKSDLRRRIQRAIEPGTRDGEVPWFLALHLEAMRGPWVKQPAVAAIDAYRVNQHRSPLSEEEREAVKAQLPKEQYEEWLAHRLEPRQQFTSLRRDDLPGVGNVCILSLSHVLHRLKDHLDRKRESRAS